MKQRFMNILFWSVISAAFIGPGTVTTAASAGAEFGYTLIWALVFSTFACVILQEASARLTVASGRNLGQVLQNRYNETLPGRGLIYLVLTAILLGCAAYEAGNILGAVAGTALITDMNTGILALVIGGAAALLLWFGSTKRVAQLLGVIVAVMGVCFLVTAIVIGPDIPGILTGSLIPSVPSGSRLLVIGLIGTTVVPYNLFLGSGLQHTQTMKEMRWSLTSAIVLGGIVSISVLIVGSAVTGDFSYRALAEELGRSLGGWAEWFFGIGLFTAGLSSALAAPLAASVTAKSILQKHDSHGWKEHGYKYRMVWIAVLATGILFGVLQIRPIPAIIIAQALNGIILPLVSVVLLLMLNDSRLLGRTGISSTTHNMIMGLIIIVTMVIGLTNLAKALTGALGCPVPDEPLILLISFLLSLCLSWPVIKTLKEYRGR